MSKKSKKVKGLLTTFSTSLVIWEISHVIIRLDQKKDRDLDKILCSFFIYHKIKIAKWYKTVISYSNICFKIKHTVKVRKPLTFSCSKTLIQDTNKHFFLESSRENNKKLSYSTSVFLFIHKPLLSDIKCQVRAALREKHFMSLPYKIKQCQQSSFHFTTLFSYVQQN